MTTQTTFKKQMGTKINFHTIKTLKFTLLLLCCIAHSAVYSQEQAIDYTKYIESFVDNDDKLDKVELNITSKRLEVNLSANNFQPVYSKSITGSTENMKITETSNGFYFIKENTDSEAKYIFHYDAPSKKMILSGIEMWNKSNGTGNEPYEISLYNDLQKIKGSCKSQNKTYNLQVSATGFSKIYLEDFSDQKMKELFEKSLNLIKNK
jgi:hypothetical protein